METKQRTAKQNNSLHLFFKQMSEHLISRGIDLKMVTENMEIPVTPGVFKEAIWKPLQKEILGKDSTTQLTTTEIDKVLIVIQKNFGQDWEIQQSFPSWETMMEIYDKYH